MFTDWAFAQKGSGVFVIRADGAVMALEYNGFLRRIASGEVRENDRVISRVLTDGYRRRVGDMRVFALIRAGETRTDDLLLRSAEGVLATGQAAHLLLEAMETGIPLPDEASLMAMQTEHNLHVLESCVTAEDICQAARSLATGAPQNALHRYLQEFSRISHEVETALSFSGELRLHRLEVAAARLDHLHTCLLNGRSLEEQRLEQITLNWLQNLRTLL